MPRSLSCLVALGLLAVLAFVGFFAFNGLIARTENHFGPPAAGLSSLQRTRLGLELGWRADALLRPVDPGAQPVRFDIALGEPTLQLVNRLQDAGLVREAGLFSSYLVYSGLDTQLQAGSYQLSPAMNAPELAAALLDPTPGSVTLVVLPGWRLEEIAASLPSAGVAFSPEDFLRAAWTPPASLPLPAGLPSGSSLEGYLLPGSYEIPREHDALQTLELLLEQGYQQVLDAALRQGFAAQGLSEHQAFILASIVQREAVIAEEIPAIAAVFANRVQIGMKLEADPTVQYAVGYDAARGGWWPRPLTFSDLGLDSPYNSYRYEQLPGPIAAPSLAALQAVAQPPQSPYFFFQAACDGSGWHVFAVTYEEHLRNNCN
ncbi:MAG: endolytic transglycosylase MltG [Anaerolineales bacterium]|nr:endolytic transglycosylase MltG [Anaerolineales bacterium]MCW5856156.1 endolytic transglycosylase MltG [Anaerolineales bacterium]